jgi:CMP-N-acetylneuraminic acid synthetase
MAINGQRVLAVIPARGGSKRCPRKNLREFRGLSLIYWSVNAAVESKYINTLVLSTDDEEIEDIGAGVGIYTVMRPTYLATDTASNEDVMRDVLRRYPDHDWVVLLQPTSPLRTSDDIDTCIELSQGKMGCISYRESTGGKNGAVYVIHSSYLERGYNFGTDHYEKYMMPDERSLDIDWPEEFLL